MLKSPSIILLPSQKTRIIESKNAKFLENDVIRWNDKFWDLVLDEDHVFTYNSWIKTQNGSSIWCLSRCMVVEQPIVDASHPAHDVIVNFVEQLSL